MIKEEIGRGGKHIMKNAIYKVRRFLIQDIDCVMTIEVTTRKELLSCLDGYLDIFKCQYHDASLEVFRILYKDGTFDYIDEDYDGHKINRQHIAAIVYDNPEDSIVFGNFEINDCGVVSPAFKEKVADDNIVEI